jgi:hypothetical protein
MSTHEDLNRAQEVTQTSERFFGLTFSVVFLLIGLYPLIQGLGPRPWSLALALLFLGLALWAPGLLRPVNTLWLRFGDLLHSITSPLILGLMFYLVITPIGLLLRLAGKDPLRLRPDPASTSYWIRREPPGPPRDSLHRQF